MARKKLDKTYVFAQMPVGKAVPYLVVPTVFTQIISILYNLADTFFVGKVGDPALVAAVGVCLPPMMLMTALANLFGVGASSAISRALGAGDERKARLCSGFSLWCGLAAALIYIALTSIFRMQFIALIGGKPQTAAYVNEYLDWTMLAGGLFYFLASLLAHFVRCIGASVPASVSVASGAVFNIVLDPFFIFVLGWGIKGVAVATVCGQMLSVLLLAGYLVRVRGDGVIWPRLSRAAFAQGIPREVVSIGLVSFCMTALAQVSNMAVNILVAPYGTAYLAASTVAIKLNIATFSIAQGLSVGVLPLIGFNYAAGNAQRVKETLRIMLGFALGVTSVCMVFALLFPVQIIAFFISDAVTLECGRAYICEIAFCMIPSSLVFACTSYLQAIGQKRRPLVLAFTRMGTVDVLLMCVCDAMLGAPWVLLGKPLADWLCCVTAAFVLRNLRRHADPYSGA